MAGKGGALARLDLSLKLTPKQEEARLAAAQERLLQLRLVLGGLIGSDPRIGPPVCVVFEGWDASGKGGAIKRLVGPLDPRHVRVAQFGAPSYDEKRHHFLWRFWPALPGWGGMAVLDRSWYGRVLVERVEGFAAEDQWRRAYREIVEFERTLADEGMIMVKFWLHLSSAEQLKRFQAREQDPLKTWKLTAEDWRNRGKRRQYKAAVEEMLDRTDHKAAPWVLVEADDKRWARVKVVESVVAAIEAGMAARHIPVPPPPPPPPASSPGERFGSLRAMGPEEFRAAGHELIDWIADYRARIPELPVQAQVGPGEVAGKLPARAPEEAEPFARLLADLDAIVVPGVTQVQHPRYFGWFPSNATLSSALGDLATAGLGALGITWQSAPALTEVEEVVVEWLRELTALPPSWRGVIQDTASTACLVALLAARERATDYSEARGGLQAESAPLTVYTTEHAHSSIVKAVALAGYGRDNLRLVGVDPVTYAMRPDALAKALEEDVGAGRRPAAVVVSVGTTGTTAVDPLAEIVPLAQQYGMWVHIDAAMAGSALLLPEMRWLIDGVEDADSLNWNPHKWLGTLGDCSLLYVADPAHLIRVMSTNPSYLRSAVDGEVTQYKDWGIPLGRRFRALKLWFQLRLDGVEAIRARLRRDLDNARWLAGQVEAAPGWRVLAPVVLQTVVLRHEPAGLDADGLNAHTLAWADAVNTSGAALVTPTLLDGVWSVRVSIGAENTERSDVEYLWRLLQHATEAAEAG